MRFSRFIIGAALVAAAVLSGCRSDERAVQNETGNTSGGTFTHRVDDLMLPSGTSIDVTLNTAITTETANVGSTWTGSVRNGVVVDGRNVIPAGSAVAGQVTSVTPAHKGDRAMLDLGMTSISVDGHNYRVHGSMESIIAGSTRARNLGAIGAATVAGAVIGHAVGGSSKGTIIGGLIGGGAATGVVSKTKGWQVALKEGTSLTFTTDDAVAVRP
jgi:hypothetical protein